VTSGDFISVVTEESPIDSFRDFDGPRLAPDDDIIEFLMRIGWPVDVPGHRTAAVKPFVSIRDQSFSLAIYEAGVSTFKIDGHHRRQTLKEVKCKHSRRSSESWSPKVLVSISSGTGSPLTNTPSVVRP